MILWLVAASFAQSACDSPVEPGAVLERAQRAEAAVADLDSTTFLAEADWLQAAIPCLDTVLTPDDAAAVHRIFALVARIERNDEDTRMAFAAARSAAPHVDLSEALAPPGSPLRDAFVALPMSVGRTDLAPVPAEGALFFDGTASQERPTSWPTVFQHTDASGALTTSTYLWPRDTLPTYPEYTGRSSQRPVSSRSPVPGLLIAGGGAALATVGAVLLVDASSQRSKWCIKQTCTESYWSSLSWRFPVGGALLAAGGVGLTTGVVIAIGPGDGVAVSGTF